MKNNLQLNYFAIKSINANFDKPEDNALASQTFRLILNNGIRLALLNDKKTIKGSFALDIIPEGMSNLSYNINISSEAYFSVENEIADNTLNEYNKYCYLLVFPEIAKLVEQITTKSGYKPIQLDITRLHFPD